MDEQLIDKNMARDSRQRPGNIPRRDFLRRSCSFLAGLGALWFSGKAHGQAGTASGAGDGLQTLVKAQTGASTSGDSRALVIIARKNVRDGDTAATYRALLEASLRRLAGTRETETAWARFFGPDDIVAIKVNAITGRLFSTSPVLVKAITDGLVSCGVREKNIIVWDRTTRELESADFPVNFARSGPLCFGTDAPSCGYDSSVTVLGSIGSCFSRIVSERATALINVPVLREHSLAGVSIALKNNYGAIHNPNKYHADGCTPFVADVNTHPAIRNMTRLNICDALRVQFHSGPGYKPKWVAELGGIIVSTDPVALDVVGTEEIEKLRKAAGLRTLREERRYPAYLSVASERGLGISDRQRMDVINIEPA